MVEETNKPNITYSVSYPGLRVNDAQPQASEESVPKAPQPILHIISFGDMPAWCTPQQSEPAPAEDQPMEEVAPSAEEKAETTAEHEPVPYILLTPNNMRQTTENGSPIQGHMPIPDIFKKLGDVTKSDVKTMDWRIGKAARKSRGVRIYAAYLRLKKRLEISAENRAYYWNKIKEKNWVVPAIGVPVGVGGLGLTHIFNLGQKFGELFPNPDAGPIMLYGVFGLAAVGSTVNYWRYSFKYLRNLAPIYKLHSADHIQARRQAFKVLRPSQLARIEAEYSEDTRTDLQRIHLADIFPGYKYWPPKNPAFLGRPSEEFKVQPLEIAL